MVNLFILGLPSRVCQGSGMAELTHHDNQTLKDSRYKLHALLDLLRAVNLVTALVPLVPDTVVRIIPNITRHLQELILNAGVRRTGIQADTRATIRASLGKTSTKPSKTVLPARPLGDGEFASIVIVGRLTNVAAVLLVVQPLAAIGCGGECAVQVLEVDLVAWADGQARCTFLIAAELELSWSDVFAELGFGVLGVVVCQVVAGEAGEVVAFACLNQLFR